MTKEIEKKLNKAMIIIMVCLTLLIIGLYVGDYFWVESYKSVPVYYQHIFENDLARYVIFDHITTGILALFFVIFLNLETYVIFKKEEKKN